MIKDLPTIQPGERRDLRGAVQQIVVEGGGLCRLVSHYNSPYKKIAPLLVAGR
jgi:hypothetical protein